MGESRSEDGGKGPRKLAAAKTEGGRGGSEGVRHSGRKRKRNVRLKDTLVRRRRRRRTSGGRLLPPIDPHAAAGCGDVPRI